MSQQSLPANPLRPARGLRNWGRDSRHGVLFLISAGEIYFLVFLYRPAGSYIAFRQYNMGKGIFAVPSGG